MLPARYLDAHPFNSYFRRDLHGGELMRKRRAWVLPEQDARSLLRQIEERIGWSDIQVQHRDVLIRLRSLIEEDLTETAEGNPERAEAKPQIQVHER
jgi:hypothetical protein